MQDNDVRLQLALDFTNLKSAIEIADQVKDYVDIIEAGSPLIKAEGLGVVKKLKERYPEKLIMADMKTADIGSLEVRMAGKAGADITTILGACPTETVQSGVEKAWEEGDIKIAVDLLGVQNLKKRINELQKCKPSYFLVHVGIDEQKAGKDPLRKVIDVAKASKTPLIVAGGIDAKLAKRLAKIDNVDVVIVGGTITRADDPIKAAQEIKAALQS